jgi:hypothetical protein
MAYVNFLNIQKFRLRVSGQGGRCTHPNGGLSVINRRRTLSRCPVVPLSRCPVAPLSRCPVAPLPRCPVAPLSRCPVVPLPRCPVVPLSRCPVAPLPRCPVAPRSEVKRLSPLYAYAREALAKLMGQ